MADDPSIGTFGNANAADALASVISKIKTDMAAIEASAKNIEASLTKASQLHFSGGGGTGGGPQFGAQNAGGGTGFSKAAGGTSRLGQITSQLGGWGAITRTGVFGGGAAIGGMGGFGGAGAMATGIAFAGLPDLIQRPAQALNMENARFGMAQATGDFGTFKRMMDVSRNNFNVQDMTQFQNTLVWGTQRAGLVGLNGGGTVGERRAASQIGGFNTLAGMAGIDQSAVPGVMKSMYGAQAYYASMAAGIMTRNPVTGETIGIEGQTNQLWNNTMRGMSGQEALTHIDQQYGIGSMGYQQLIEQYGNEDAADMVVEGLRIRARQGGKALTENQVQDQAKGIPGGLGGEMTQGNEGTRRLESARLNMGEEYLNDATAGIEEATKHISNAVDLLVNLEGPLRDMVGAYTTFANQMDVFKEEVPGLTKGLTDFFGGLPGLLIGLLMGGGKGGLLAKGGQLLGRGMLAMAGTAALPLAGLGAALAGTTVAVGLAGKWAVNRYTDYDEHHGAGTNAGIAANAGRGTPSSSGYGTSSGSSAASSSSGSRRAPAPTPNASGYGSHSKGSWFVEADQDTRIHQGEMILPNRVANAVRRELDSGKDVPSRGGNTVNIFLTVQNASDQEAVSFANKVKRVLDDDQELLAIGSGRLARAHG